MAKSGKKNPGFPFDDDDDFNSLFGSADTNTLSGVNHGTGAQKSAIVATSAPSALAETLSATLAVDLTASGNFGLVGDAVFAADQVKAGTGAFPSFLQLVHSGTEQA